MSHLQFPLKAFHLTCALIFYIEIDILSILLNQDLQRASVY